MFPEQCVTTFLDLVDKAAKSNSHTQVQKSEILGKLLQNLLDQEKKNTCDSSTVKQIIKDLKTEKNSSEVSKYALALSILEGCFISATPTQSVMSSSSSSSSYLSSAHTPVIRTPVSRQFSATPSPSASSTPPNINNINRPATTTTRTMPVQQQTTTMSSSSFLTHSTSSTPTSSSSSTPSVPVTPSAKPVVTSTATTKPPTTVTSSPASKLSVVDKFLKSAKEQSTQIEKTQQEKLVKFEGTGRDTNQNFKNAMLAVVMPGLIIKKLEILKASPPKPKDCDVAGKAHVDAAKMVIDPLIKSRWIVNDFDPSSDLVGMEKARLMEAHLQVILKEYGLNDPKDPLHWYAKGMILAHAKSTDKAHEGQIPILCDGCTALVFYTLHAEAGFVASLGVIQQGGGGMGLGHWFIAAGSSKHLQPQKYKFPYHGREVTCIAPHPECLVIDLWGAFVVKNGTAVVKPVAFLGMEPSDVLLKCKL
jgi:hypothetical protein